MYSHAKSSKTFGVTAENVKFDLSQAMANKNKIVERLRKASESSKKKLKVEVVTKTANVLGTENGAFRVKAEETVYEAKRLLLCTGSEAIRPPIPGADQKFVMTNREILNIDYIPSNLVIVGGGVIGLEFATFFSEIGAKVTVIEMLPAIAGQLDDDIRAILQKSFEKKGVVFHLECQVTGIEKDKVLFKDKAGNTQSVPADAVLLSTGRRPVTKGIGLENLHLDMDRSAVKTDLQSRTNIPNVYAAGDINGKSMLAHTASRESEVAVDTMLGHKNVIRYDNIPGVIYSHPEVATVGLTLAQAKQRGIDAAESNITLNYSGRYMVENEAGNGIIKVVADKASKTILGMHMIGGECSEMIHGACIILENQLRLQDVADIVFPHPTVAEVIKIATAAI
jgi:dihydrolipoamide dehydrogenase